MSVVLARRYDSVNEQQSIFEVRKRIDSIDTYYRHDIMALVNITREIHVILCLFLIISLYYPKILTMTNQFTFGSNLTECYDLKQKYRRSVTFSHTLKDDS
mmetsp:Transcript_31018/g.70967  ORF Transcript_31018/g.70967 Transcript_31018/m.70967 type:complete len:101 (+) Transcript_31018:150-452(+)